MSFAAGREASGRRRLARSNIGFVYMLNLLLGNFLRPDLVQYALSGAARLLAPSSSRRSASFCALHVVFNAYCLSVFLRIRFTIVSLVNLQICQISKAPLLSFAVARNKNINHGAGGQQRTPRI
jgi:hypothetical protein